VSPPRDDATVAVGTRAARPQAGTSLPIPRPRLLNLLQRATHNRLTLLSAPAGFGKSTLLQQLRATHPRTVRILPTMTPPPECACPAGTVVVVDEREPLTRPLSTDDLVELLDVLPDGAHLVASRRQPWTDDDVALFGFGPIERLRADDLVFTRAEAEALLNAAHLDVTSADANLLRMRTGGWAAGLGSAIIAMRDVDDVLTYIEVLGGDDRHVASYLRAEVISQLDDDELDLLSCTSVIDQLEPGISAWMTTDGGAPSRLAGLHRKGIIEEHDGVALSYTMHPMLRDHLWRVLKEADAVTARTCATRAALWHTIRGELDMALPLYVKGEAWTALLQMVDRSGRQLVRSGLEREVADALSCVPPAARGRRRANLIDYAAFQTWGGDRQAAEDTLARLTDRRADPSEQALIDVLHAARVRLHGRGASAAEAATAAITAIGAGDLGTRRLAGISASDLEAFTRTLRGTARWYEGDVAGARSDFESALDRPSRVPPWALRAEGGLALLEASVGHLTRAEFLAQNALSRAAHNGLRRNQCTVEALLAIAMVHRQRNDLEKVVRPLGTAQHLAKTGHEAVALALAMIEQARDELAGGDAHEGFDTLSESRRALAAVDSSRFTRLADAVEAQLLLATGRADRALKLLTADGPTDDSDVCANTVRALLEQRMLDEAVRSLKEWQPASELRPMLQRRMWSAVIEHVAGSRRTATRSFAEVAVEAETEGFVRLFVDAGPLVARLLNDTLALQPSDYLEAISMQLSTPHAPGARHDGACRRDIPALLSQRELEVVRYLPTRLSAIEIAEHLYISYNTLKSHMRSIYRKFGVSSRQELIRRAEELGLA